MRREALAQLDDSRAEALFTTTKSTVIFHEITAPDTSHRLCQKATRIRARVPTDKAFTPLSKTCELVYVPLLCRQRRRLISAQGRGLATSVWKFRERTVQGRENTMAKRLTEVKQLGVSNDALCGQSRRRVHAQNAKISRCAFGSFGLNLVNTPRPARGRRNTEMST